MKTEKINYKDFLDEALMDSQEILNYSNTLLKTKSTDNTNTPDFFNVLKTTENNSKKAKTYAAFLGIGMAGTYGALGALGAGMSLTALPFLATPLVALSPIGIIPTMIIGASALTKIAVDISTKKHISKNTDKIEKTKEELVSKANKITEWLNELNNKYQNNKDEYSKKIEEYAIHFAAIAKEKAHETKISLDDLINLDTNKRIQEYNKIVLKQYQLQKDNEEKIQTIVFAYKKLEEENKKLTEDIIKLQEVIASLNIQITILQDALQKGGNKK